MFDVVWLTKLMNAGTLEKRAWGMQYASGSHAQEQHCVIQHCAFAQMKYVACAIGCATSTRCEYYDMRQLFSEPTLIPCPGTSTQPS